MGTLNINKEFINDFLASKAPCMTLGLATYNKKRVVFIVLRPDKEIRSAGTTIGAAFIPVPNHSAIQFHFITDSLSYYYCLLNPAFDQVRNAIANVKNTDILFMIIQPTNTGSSGLLAVGSEIHKNLVAHLDAINSCKPTNDISDMSHLADNFLGKIGHELSAVCVNDTKDYHYFENCMSVEG